MTHLSRSLLRRTALAAGALTVLSVAVPAATAAPQGDRIANQNRPVKMAQTKEDRRAKTSPHRREYRRDGRADRRADRRDERRTERRADRREERRTERRADRREERRTDRRADRREDRRVDRRTDRREDRRADRRADRRDHRSHRRDHTSHRRYYGSDRGRYSHRSRHHYKPRYSRPARHGYRHGGYHSSYRSGLGISFHIGSPGYSRFRWAPTAYSFYRPSYGHYGAYQRHTTCRRVVIDGWHHGHREEVSVKQCTNPWDGTYIVQGSERVIACRW